MIERLAFESGGVDCAAWLYRNEGSSPQPLVVVAHGLPGTHAMYWKVADAYSAAGFTVLDFDNRFVGASGGEPRQTISVKVQQEDLRAALAYARTLSVVDRNRIALYGSSFGGGLAIDVAADDPGIAALVLVVPLVDGSTNLPGSTLSWRLRWARRALGDRAGRVRGRPPRLLTVFGEPGSDALITRDGVMETIEGVVPTDGTWDPVAGVMTGAGSRFENTAAVWETMMAANYRPGRRLAKVRCPVLMLSGDRDSVCPPGPQRKAAGSLSNVTVETGDFNHFDPFLRRFDELMDVQVKFLRSQLTTTLDQRSR